MLSRKSKSVVIASPIWRKKRQCDMAALYIRSMTAAGMSRNEERNRHRVVARLRK